jgi:hypothetical protein
MLCSGGYEGAQGLGQGGALTRGLQVWRQRFGNASEWEGLGVRSFGDIPTQQEDEGQPLDAFAQLE